MMDMAQYNSRKHELRLQHEAAKLGIHSRQHRNLLRWYFRARTAVAEHLDAFTHEQPYVGRPALLEEGGGIERTNLRLLDCHYTTSHTLADMREFREWRRKLTNRITALNPPKGATRTMPEHLNQHDRDEIVRESEGFITGSEKLANYHRRKLHVVEAERATVKGKIKAFVMKETEKQGSVEEHVSDECKVQVH